MDKTNRRGFVCFLFVHLLGLSLRNTLKCVIIYYQHVYIYHYYKEMSILLRINEKNISLEILMWMKSQFIYYYDREMLPRPECQTRKGRERNVYTHFNVFLRDSPKFLYISYII